MKTGVTLNLFRSIPDGNAMKIEATQVGSTIILSADGRYAGMIVKAPKGWHGVAPGAARAKVRDHYESAEKAATIAFGKDVAAAVARCVKA